MAKNVITDAAIPGRWAATISFRTSTANFCFRGGATACIAETAAYGTAAHRALGMRRDFNLISLYFSRTGFTFHFLAVAGSRTAATGGLDFMKIS